MTSIFVGSYDNNNEIGKYFCYGIEKYGPDRQGEIKAVTNIMDFPCGEGLKVGGDNIGSVNVKRGLEKIDDDIIIFMNDDSWLTGFVKNTDIIDFVEIIRSGESKHIRLLNTKNVKGVDTSIDKRLYEFHVDSKYRTSVCNGIGDVNTLYDLIEEGETPGEFERKGTKRSKVIKEMHYTKKNYYMPHVVPACGWKWTPVRKREITESGKKGIEMEGL